MLTNKLGEFRRLYRFREGNFTAVTPEMNMDVLGFAIDDARRRLYYTVNDGGFTRLRVLDARTFQARALPRDEGRGPRLRGDAQPRRPLRDLGRRDRARAPRELRLRLADARP